MVAMTNNKQLYRAYLIVNGTAHFTKKLTLEKAIEYMQVMAMNSWTSGMIDAELSLSDAQVIFRNVVEPKCGWEDITI